MKKFLDDNFLLESKIAETLYHDYAKHMPIFDYHCHLSAKEIAEDITYDNIADVWLKEDHYKWRALRANGINEEYITGNKSAKEKFWKWAETLPHLLGNPLHHWTHLELQRLFGITEILNEDSAESIWKETTKVLNNQGLSAKYIIKHFNVKALCTTDDPVDSLKYHKVLKEDTNFNVKVLPTFRPDNAMNINSVNFIDWLAKLKAVTSTEIKDLKTYLNALYERIECFHEVGCRLSDHGIDDCFYEYTSYDECEGIFQKAYKGKQITNKESIKFRSFILLYLGGIYKEKGWAMQLHIGAVRNTNTKMQELVGINTGFDSIADFNYLDQLVSLFDTLNYHDNLPKTIVYNLNPCDNYLLATFIGNYQKDIPGKIQFGSAWWFNDHKDGIEAQIKTLANVGLLSRFIGMLTDSRSLLSYTRHEYFRRILSNIIADWMNKGEIPHDLDYAGKIIQNICFNNVNNYLNVELD